MKHTNIPSAQTVIAYCKAAGIKDIVISPGSRNAPLTLGFTEDSFFNCYSIVDERSAAFFALGLAQQSGIPAALVCTSGSAVLNYYPAVAEAYYSDIPLLVLTADRPPYKIDIGDGQTIRQDQVLHRHSRYSATLLQDASHATETFRDLDPARFEKEPVETLQKRVQAFNELELQLAIRTAFEQSGPVHLNIPFEEPLYGLVDKPVVEVNPSSFKGSSSGLPSDFEALLHAWEGAERILIIAGVLPPGSIPQDLLNWLGDHPRVLVMTETTSNLHHPSFISSIDSLMAPLELNDAKKELYKELQPDLLITLGGMIVSKKVKAFLRTYKPAQHWHLGEVRAYDTFFALSRHVRVKPESFLGKISERSEVKPGSYQARWLPWKKKYQEGRGNYLREIGFSDFSAFASIFDKLPGPLQLQLANSSTIRYSQLFPMREDVTVFCNRGTSGIEGSTSTAVGAALHSDRPTLLLSGDLSFLYDTNGLWNQYLRPDFRIIVMNNQGGGIFRILPGVDSTPHFGRYFETVHQTPLEPICSTYGISYCSAENENELERQLETFFERSENPRLLEVKTPRLENNKILLRYFDFIS